MEAAAVQVLTRAVELDRKGRYTEAKICYLEGTQLLYDHVKTLPEGKKRTHMITQIEEYTSRAELIQKIIEEQGQDGSYHEKISIQDDSIGHSFESVFGRFLGIDVTSVIVEDPYIRTRYQCQNFLRFCELVVKKCLNLKTIHLVTNEGQRDKTKNPDQIKWLNQFRAEMQSRHKINLSFEISPTLHDRQIKLSNGWTIQIGRGLDYFKPPENAGLSLGQYDLDLRPCHETTVNIYHKKSITLKPR